MTATLVVGAVFLVGAFLFVSLLESSLRATIDSAARTRAHDIAALLTRGDLPRTLAVAGEEDSVVQVVDQSGQVVASSDNIEGESRLAAFRAVDASDSAIRTVHDVPIGNNGNFRVAAIRARSVGQPVTIYVGVSLRQLQHTVAMVRILFAAGLPCVLTLVAATTWFTVGQALRPIEAIRREVADISERALNRRVPEPPVNDEVGRLARTMNRMTDWSSSRFDSAVSWQTRPTS